MTHHRHGRQRSAPFGSTSAERPCYRAAHRTNSSIIRNVPLRKMITRRSEPIYHTTFQAPHRSIGYCVVGNLRCFVDVDAAEVNLNPTCSNVADHSSPSSHDPEPYIQTKSPICLDADKAQKRKLPPRKKANRVRKERDIRAEKGRRYNKKPRAGETNRTVSNSERE